MTPEQLTEIPGIGEKMVEKIQLSVAAYFQSLENPQAGDGIAAKRWPRKKPRREPAEQAAADGRNGRSRRRRGGRSRSSDGSRRNCAKPPQRTDMRAANAEPDSVSRRIRTSRANEVVAPEGNDRFESNSN